MPSSIYCVESTTTFPAQFMQQELLWRLLCRTTACFERNLHTQIFGGDSVVSTPFSVITLWTLLFCSMTHYDITIGNDVARDVHSDIIMDHDVVLGTYHDVTMQTDVARMLIYYVLIRPIIIFLFS